MTEPTPEYEEMHWAFYGRYCNMLLTEYPGLIPSTIEQWVRFNTAMDDVESTRQIQAHPPSEPQTESKRTQRLALSLMSRLRSKVGLCWVGWHRASLTGQITASDDNDKPLRSWKLALCQKHARSWSDALAKVGDGVIEYSSGVRVVVNAEDDCAQ